MSKKHLLLAAFLVTLLILLSFSAAYAAEPRGLEKFPNPIDPQSWLLQRDMTWSDFNPNPVIDWKTELNPASLDNKFAHSGNSPNQPIIGGLLLFEYLDRKFISRGEAGSDPLGYYLFNQDGSGMQDTVTKNPMYNVPKLIAQEKGIDIKDVTDTMFARWWADFLNKSLAVNNGTSIDEFWRECSYGKWATELDPYGPFTIPYFEFETMGYDHGSSFQTYRDVPPSFRTGASGTGNGASFDTQARTLAVAQGVPFETFDFFFYLHAGYDESGVWQEFGQSQFATRKDIPYELGPGPRMKKVEEFFTENPEWLATYRTRYSGTPSAAFWAGELAKYEAMQVLGTEKDYIFKLQDADWEWVNGYNDQTQRNTRYVPFTAWEAAVSEWSHAGTFTYNGRSIRCSTQGESDGMAGFAHEFGHISGIADNYGSPWTDTASPATEPWELMSRGCFAGPGGDHARWTVPGIEANTVPVHFMHRNKEANRFYDDDDVLTLTVQDLAGQTPLVTEVVARNIPLNNNGFYPWLEDYGLISPNYYKAIKLNFGSGIWADRAGVVSTGFTWTRRAAANMTVEVVDQTGYDSFNHDHGVILARTHVTTSNPYVAIIDSHLYDIAMLDYVLNGEPNPYPLAHTTQLADAAFHAGVSSVDTGYYATQYGVKTGNNPANWPVLKNGSVFRWEERDGRDVVSGNTVNEFYDAANKLHFYILKNNLTPAKYGSFLSYTIGMLHDDGPAVGGELIVSRGKFEAADPGRVATQWFNVKNTGDATDIIRITADCGLDFLLLNNLYAIGAGETIEIPVYIQIPAADPAFKPLTFTASSESNAAKAATVNISDFSAYIYAPAQIYIKEGNKIDYVVSVLNVADEGANLFTIEAAFDAKNLNYLGYTFNLSPVTYSPTQGPFSYDVVGGKLTLDMYLARPGVLLKADTETPLITFHFSLKDGIPAGPDQTVVDGFLSNVKGYCFIAGKSSPIDAIVVKPGAPTKILIHPLGYEGGDLDEATISWLIYHHLYKTDAAGDWDEIKKYDLNGNNMIDLADIVALWSLIGK